MSRMKEDFEFLLDYYDILKNRNSETAGEEFFAKLQALVAAEEISRNTADVFFSVKQWCNELGVEECLQMVGVIAGIVSNTKQPMKPKIRYSR